MTQNSALPQDQRRGSGDAERKKKFRVCLEQKVPTSTAVFGLNQHPQRTSWSVSLFSHFRRRQKYQEVEVNRNVPLAMAHLMPFNDYILSVLSQTQCWLTLRSTGPIAAGRHLG